MKATKFEEKYSIEGRDEQGLIPQGVEEVIVGYDVNGKPQYIFYRPSLSDGWNNITKSGIRERLEWIDRRTREVNSKELTQVEITSVAGLLKKLSKPKTKKR